MLHCSPSELPLRCPEITDEPLIVAYLSRKADLESRAMNGTGGSK
jgi:hypothetical protein